MKLFNGYVLGTSGGGKSFDVKVRKADDFAFDEPIVIDPEKLGVDVAPNASTARIHCTPLSWEVFLLRMARCSPTTMVGPYVLPSTETDHAASGIVPSRS